MEQERGMMTTKQVAEELNVHIKTVRRWINSGKIEAVNIGGEDMYGQRYRIPRQEFEKFLRQRKNK